MNEDFNIADFEGDVLRLTLSELPFNVMLTGEKPDEYRRASDWIKSRLAGKSYTYVAFFHGPYTGGKLPWFVCHYQGYGVAAEAFELTFSNGLHVPVAEGDYIIHLGLVVASGNLKKPKSSAAVPTIEKTEAAAD